MTTVKWQISFTEYKSRLKGFVTCISYLHNDIVFYFIKNYFIVDVLLFITS